MSKKAPSGLDLLGNQIKNVADGSSPSDAVNLLQVQNLLRGLAFKEPVRAATTANISLTAPGATIDGVTMNVGEAFLAKDQTTSADKGIYIWNGASTAATRRNDADTGTELRAGVSVTVTEGTANGDKVFMIISDGAVTVGTTAQTWGQLGGGGQSYTGGNGISIAGTVISGVVKASGGLILDANGFYIDTTTVTRKAAGNMGNGSLTSIPVTHNLGTTDVQVQVRLVSTGEEVIVEWIPTDANTVTFSFPTAPSSGAYRWSIQG